MIGDIEAPALGLSDQLHVIGKTEAIHQPRLWVGGHLVSRGHRGSPQPSP